ncbi:MAG: hypothetical protein ACK44D_07905 [Bacteroidia bacterium]
MQPIIHQLSDDSSPEISGWLERRIHTRQWTDGSYDSGTNRKNKAG